MATIAAATATPLQNMLSSTKQSGIGPTMTSTFQQKPNGIQNYSAYNTHPPPFGTPFVSPHQVNTAAKPPTGIVKVGFYEVDATIGRGNFAVVKIAKHRVTRTDVCF